MPCLDLSVSTGAVTRHSRLSNIPLCQKMKTISLLSSALILPYALYISNISLLLGPILIHTSPKIIPILLMMC